jgi:hypothetical protein
MLRSKSLDRDSYNSGDWFNRLDFTYMINGWGAGLPVEEVNGDNWSIMEPLLSDLPSPGVDDIGAAAEHMREVMEIRTSSPLFSLETASDVQERVTFHNTGPDQIPGLVVMEITDPENDDIDREFDRIVVLFNATDASVGFDSVLDGTQLDLHPVQADSVDPVVKTSEYDSADGSFSIPARTTAVFVEDEPDVTPPTGDATLDPIRVLGNRVGLFEVSVICTDESSTTTTIEINGVDVEDGQRVWLYTTGGRQRNQVIGGVLRIWAPGFEMSVTCVDEAGNETVVTVEPEFG